MGWIAASWPGASGECGALFNHVCGCRISRRSGRRFATRANDCAGDTAWRWLTTLCAREWAFRTGEASAGAMKSRQATATASAAVTCLIFEGATGIKFTCTGQAGTMADNYSRIYVLWEFSTVGSSELTTSER